MKMIPALRFPEFKNEGEWDNVVLGRISEIVRGGSPRPIQDYTTTDLNGLNWLKIADVPSDSKYITETKERVIKEAINSTREVNSGDLILSNSMSFGRPYILKITTCIHDGWIAIRKISNRTFEDYLYYFISSESCQSYFQTNAAGAAVKNLNAEIIKLLPIYLPKNKREQQKIASCLSSLDEVIAAHSQKLELLKDHKKGLMQNLFPQEGETVPKYRFKEFEKDGEWVEKPLNDVCKLVRGPFGGALKKEIFVKEGFAVYEQSHAIYSDFSSFRYYIDEEKFNELKRFSVKPGDLIMSCSGTMGKFAIVPEDYKIGVINQALLKLTAKKGYDNLFVKMTLEADNNQEKLLSQSAGGAIKNVVSVSQIRELGLFIPSIKEQQKVASCLSSLGAIITSQSDKIEQLQLHKKGLMQGLFPKIND